MKSKSLFAKNLGNILRERQLSLRAAAKMAGVSPSVVSGWSAGAQPTNVLAVHRLAKALGVSFEWLLTGEHSSETITTFNWSEFFEEEAAFSGIYRFEAKKLTRKKNLK